MSDGDFEELEVLFDRSSGVAVTSAGDAVERLHGGPLRLPAEVVFANFVSSVDGVAALRDRTRSSAEIGGGNVADRFMMGVLRSCADAILVGAGTVRAHPNGRWTPEAAYPAGADDFDAIRRRLGATAHPRLVVVSRHGDFDPAHPGIDGALLATTEQAAPTVAPELQRSCETVVYGKRDVDLGALIRDLRRRGHRRILTEGGPLLLGRLLGADAIDTLFLTISPVIAGRTGDGDRPGIVDGLAFEPACFPDAMLTGARRSHDHLFLRYEVSRAG